MNKLIRFDAGTFDEAVFSRLSRNVRVVNAFDEASLVDFLDAGRYPVHRWFFLREGFSPEIFHALADRLRLSAADTVLDPFCGGGTTPLAAQERGVNSIGFEVNPLMFFISKVKTHPYTREDFNEIKALVDVAGRLNFKPAIKAPNLSQIEVFFHDDGEDVLEKLLMYKEFISGVESAAARDFLMLGWLSILERVSNTRKGGAGLRMEKRFNKNPSRVLKEKYSMMLDDLKRITRSPRPKAGVRLFNGSILDSGGKVTDGSVKAAVTSPPYPNCFDYLEIYKLDLWMGDFIKSRQYADEINNKSIRSHLNMPLKKGANCRNRELMDDMARIINRIPKASLWDKRIPQMIRGYFDDMSKVLEVMHAKLKQGGSCIMVAGNVSYGGAIIPVDLALSQLALDAGFKDVEIKVARLLNPDLAPKQLEAGGKNLRESIITMIKG